MKNKIKKILNSLNESEINELKQALQNKGIQEIKDNSNIVNDYSLPEQGKLTQHEQKLINKYKDKGVNFTDLLLTIDNIEKQLNEQRAENFKRNRKKYKK